MITIAANEYKSNTASNSDTRWAIPAAKQVKSDFDELSRDVVSLDNVKGVDSDPNTGVICLNHADILKFSHRHYHNPNPHPDPEFYDHDAVYDFEGLAGGKVILDGQGKVTEMHLKGLGGIHLDAHRDFGFLGAGQERVTVQESVGQCTTEEIGTYFADGTVLYNTK